MTIPFTINTVYTPATPVKSTDLNEIQQSLNGNKHPDKVQGINGSAFFQISGTAVTKNFSSITSAGACVVNYCPVLHQGDRLKKVSLQVSGNGVADITAFDVYKVTSAGAEVLLGTVAITNPGVPFATFDNDFADYTLVAGDTIRVSLSINAANITVGGCLFTYDHP